MPTWGQVLNELKEIQEKEQKPGFDEVRRKYLTALSEHTGRNTILYATQWTSPGAPPEAISVTMEDVHAMMEVVHGLKGDELDLILHSPGGSPEATMAIVSYLRSKFTHIRVIVPLAAMSAATMMACAANEIIMGRQSSLGPIDPQMVLDTRLGFRPVPAQAILDQFKRAQNECKNPAALGSWIPILEQYGPALLEECENALKLSEELAATWLETYMFAGEDEAEARAKAIAQHLRDHTRFKAHGRPISRDEARGLAGAGLKVVDLEDDQTLQDLVLSVYHATEHTFASTSAVKVVENQKGRAFIKQSKVMMVQGGGPPEGRVPAVPHPMP